MTPDREAATPFVVPETPSEARQGATRADIPSLVTEEMVAEAIRALSPLPPGARVVVIPAEWPDHVLAVAGSAVLDACPYEGDPRAWGRCVAKTALDAALRALTEEPGR